MATALLLLDLTGLDWSASTVDFFSPLCTYYLASMESEFSPTLYAFTFSSNLLPSPARSTFSGSGETDCESPYTAGARSRLPTLAEKFSLSPDISQWGFDVSTEHVEPDDEMHSPESESPLQSRWSDRGAANIGCLALLCAVLLSLFAGYPIFTFWDRHSALSRLRAGLNGTGQIPLIIGFRGLIDVDTPRDAWTKPSWKDGSEMTLVFSDEFNVDGRTFYAGDDPYWEAVDLHYWATNNLEWYDPAAVTTSNGSLVITLSKKPTHGLAYEGGMLSSWNKFCFTGGYIETAVSLPGPSNVIGLWPAIWTLGNLGRAGYGASLEGLWPYTYDGCDVGTVANQTIHGQPHEATINGDVGKNGALSYLPGQRLSRCTCPGESHPGPMHADGSFVGRSAPEIDVLEAQMQGDPKNGIPYYGQVSQSAQWAPFNAAYRWSNTSANEIIANRSISAQNHFTGSCLQQATSVVTTTNQDCYEGEKGCFAIYGFEYKPGFNDAYITWINDNKIAWTLLQEGMSSDSRVEISGRPVSQESMYILMNLGMSFNFGDVDLEHLPFPVHMRVDYIRVYQPANARNIGCDPPDFPTKAYIDRYIEAYTNPNLTTWGVDYGQPIPKNRFLGQC